MKDSTSQRPIKLGMVGAGIFATESHLPALLSLGPVFQIVAVFSRTMQAAQALANRLLEPAQAYDDLPAMLARTDIEAVDIVLPIMAIPPAVEAALAAGKHVISEKPLAPDVATGRRLLAASARRPGQLWAIAENVRYAESHVKAAEMMAGGEIGRPLLCFQSVQIDLSPSNRYYRTPWRRDGTVPGGPIMDAGIHNAALLRFLLGEVAAVSAVTAQMRPDLAPIDTLSAAIEFESGALGSFSITCAAGSPWRRGLHILGDRGSLFVSGEEIELAADDKTQRLMFAASPNVRDDVRNELAAFAAGIRLGQSQRNTPLECLRDVSLMEAMLRSAQTGQREVPERI